MEEAGAATVAAEAGDPSRQAAADGDPTRAATVGPGRAGTTDPAQARVIGNSGYRTHLDLELPGPTTASVDVSSGNLLLSFVDLRLPDLDSPASVGRTYNSLATATGPLGPGWRLNTGFELELDVRDPSAPVAVGATGAVERFVRREDGTFVAEGAFDARLRRTAAGYVLRLGPDEHATAFDAAGSVVRVADPHGGGLADDGCGIVFATTVADGRPRLARQDAARGGPLTWFSYDGDGRVVRVADAGGRRLDYRYADGRLAARTVGDRAPQEYAYDAAGRLATVHDGGRRLLHVAYDAQGRVRRTTAGRVHRKTATRATGDLVLEFEYRADATAVRGSDGSVRQFDVAVGGATGGTVGGPGSGVIGEDRAGPAPPRVRLGGPLVDRLPRTVDPAEPYVVTVAVDPVGEPIADVAVWIDGALTERFDAPRADAADVVAVEFELCGEEHGPSALLVVVVATTTGGSATTRRLVVRVPEDVPEPQPVPDDEPEPHPLPGATDPARRSRRPRPARPVTPDDLARGEALRERDAHQRLHDPVLRYAREQPDFAGAWWEAPDASDGQCATPVVAFSGRLERHRRAIDTLPQAPGLRVVQRPHPLADLQAAARRALGFRSATGRTFSTSVDERTGRPVIRVVGRLSPEDRRRLVDLLGVEADITDGLRVRSGPRRPRWVAGEDDDPTPPTVGRENDPAR